MARSPKKRFNFVDLFEEAAAHKPLNADYTQQLQAQLAHRRASDPSAIDTATRILAGLPLERRRSRSRLGEEAELEGSGMRSRQSSRSSMDEGSPRFVPRFAPLPSLPEHAPYGQLPASTDDRPDRHIVLKPSAVHPDSSVPLPRPLAGRRWSAPSPGDITAYRQQPHQPMLSNLGTFFTRMGSAQMRNGKSKETKYTVFAYRLLAGANAGAGGRRGEGGRKGKGAGGVGGGGSEERFEVDRSLQVFTAVEKGDIHATPQYTLSLMEFLGFQWVALRFKSPNDRANNRLAFDHVVVRAANHPNSTTVVIKTTTEPHITWACAVLPQGTSVELLQSSTQELMASSANVKSPEELKAQGRDALPWLDMPLYLPKSQQYLRTLSSGASMEADERESAPSPAAPSHESLPDRLSSLPDWLFGRGPYELLHQWRKFTLGTKEAEARRKREDQELEHKREQLARRIETLKARKAAAKVRRRVRGQRGKGEVEEGDPKAVRRNTFEGLMHSRSTNIGSDLLVQGSASKEAIAWGSLPPTPLRLMRSYTAPHGRDMTDGDAWIRQANKAFAPNTHPELAREREKAAEWMVLDVS
ncbi:unnamed protein product [Vitrella brassicaformis CCMP3155]|uniref:Uncharacterized protein n=2 Tax=Vitrella brassicaformis TaxID=1169539 RepID=A0A0G4ECJ7_VITBC|nr:unnamed protein product [Vitrella brassicaformis CCMP3155]|eukprot:CEL93462.1 unnamed protein product [Vitrella brassicaformis CCMP3155]